MIEVTQYRSTEKVNNVYCFAKALNAELKIDAIFVSA
jgi:hypothetical protein